MAKSEANDVESSIWYLGYGANMNPKSLSGNRKVYPLQSTPCTVPNYKLCFTVPFMPYMEPAFASIKGIEKTGKKDVLGNPTLHGVVHKITKDDFVQIQRTEGGGGYEGTGYNVEIVKCVTYSGETIDAVTLVFDSNLERENIHPSKRYWDLLVEGAKHHKVNETYVKWLESQPYYIIPTDLRRQIGRYMFLLSTIPMLIFVVPAMLINKKLLLIRPPRYLFRAMNYLIYFYWTMHDYMFVKVFGSGAK